MNKKLILGLGLILVLVGVASGEVYQWVSGSATQSGNVTVRVCDTEALGDCWYNETCEDAAYGDRFSCLLNYSPNFGQDYYLTVEINGSPLIWNRTATRWDVFTSSSGDNFVLPDDGWIGDSVSTERIVFDADGDDIEIMGGSVGIGTISPEQKLHVTSSSDAGVLFESTGGSAVKIKSDSDYAYVMHQNSSDDYRWITGTAGAPDYYFRNQALSAVVQISQAGVLKVTALGGGGTQYVCTDNVGALSAGASCTEFEILDDNYPVSMTDDEFKILDVQEETSLDEVNKGKLLNYHYKVAFGTLTSSKLGWIKVPLTLSDEYEVLHYLRQKIIEYKGGSMSTKKSIDNDMVGQTYSLLDFNDRAQVYADNKEVDIIEEEHSINTVDNNNNIIDTEVQQITRKIRPADIQKVDGKWQVVEPEIIYTTQVIEPLEIER